ncbi:hypothetical protein BGZ60DRAFT_431355 [Tricladium varicosporioides]|nr:hypothetical protein BGZ60DRAFT_431355 [Hymenoscyphus varicosporioides]
MAQCTENVRDEGRRDSQGHDPDGHQRPQRREARLEPARGGRQKGSQPGRQLAVDNALDVLSSKAICRENWNRYTAEYIKQCEQYWRDIAQNQGGDGKGGANVPFDPAILACRRGLHSQLLGARKQHNSKQQAQLPVPSRGKNGRLADCRRDRTLVPGCCMDGPAMVEAVWVQPKSNK